MSCSLADFRPKESFPAFSTEVLLRKHSKNSKPVDFNGFIVQYSVFSGINTL